jgi:tetratricopeptide (TPR) repeat protein
MTRSGSVLLAILLSAASLLYGQVDKIVIPAGTPEDQALNAINNEQDAQKRLAMYQEFLEKFASNPVAVAYANWQLSQYYQTAGDLQKASEYGNKAAAGAPHNIDILVSEVTIAQGLKDNARTFKYAIQGGEAFDSIEKQSKPADVSDEQFASSITHTTFSKVPHSIASRLKATLKREWITLSNSRRCFRNRSSMSRSRRTRCCRCHN